MEEKSDCSSGDAQHEERGDKFMPDYAASPGTPFPSNAPPLLPQVYAPRATYRGFRLTAPLPSCLHLHLPLDCGVTSMTRQPRTQQQQ